MKLYQGGPMRGYENYNFNAFAEGAEYLRYLGHAVISPHQIDVEDELVHASWTQRRSEAAMNGMGILASVQDFYSVELTDKFTIEAALKRDFEAILACDAVSFLPWWEDSEGCQRECAVAKWIGLPIYEHEPWLYFAESTVLA